ncbi:MAG: S-methyl-5-thioribose-1-phosphate isomerase [Chloroflexi bacterium]|nr:MAG: S-methyl-5-thioribose-1-phosphate isomerase [Chloroflexota bacterium]
MPPYHAIEWKNNSLTLLDQRLLPHETVYVTLQDVSQVVSAIKDMTIRGAPAIGAAAAYGLALEAGKPFRDLHEILDAVDQAGKRLMAARPTAVNLAWAVQRVLKAAHSPISPDVDAVRRAVIAEAHTIANEEVQNNIQIGQNALPLWPETVTFLHHCNTGALATVDYGTALGVIRAAHEHGKKVMVYVDETRPRLQGARLTAWELEQLGIPYKIIADGASGHVLRHCGVDAVTVGCDRIAANGDTANKIGTYNLAIVARAHRVPFYIVGPTSTIDLNTPDGAAIPIEERSAEEITKIGNEWIAPKGAPAYNPAFDITPAEYISAIITEQGIAYPPFARSLPEMVAKAQNARSANVGRDLAR